MDDKCEHSLHINVKVAVVAPLPLTLQARQALLQIAQVRGEVNLDLDQSNLV